MPYFSAPDGTELFYRDYGIGSPVVFVHSMLMSSHMWQHQMLHLADTAIASSPTTDAVTADPTPRAPDTNSTPLQTIWPP